MEHSQNQSRQSSRISILNDDYRDFLPSVPQLYLTSGIRDALGEHLDELIEAVRKFDAFTPDNDPYGEHDFGAVEVQGVAVWWKFNYYDRELKYHSPDPADDSVTRRVLTIMLPSEY